jgi:hypothetical protein
MSTLSEAVLPGSYCALVKQSIECNGGDGSGDLESTGIPSSSLTEIYPVADRDILCKDTTHLAALRAANPGRIVYYVTPDNFAQLNADGHLTVGT